MKAPTALILKTDRPEMPTRLLAGIILASVLVTLDGTATTIALPAIGRDLAAPIFRLQWISNAPLLVLAALLLPAGSIADRFGRVRVIRAGLVAFAAGAVGCALAPSDLLVIGARFLQGAGGALILPAVLAVLRGAYEDATARARIFGLWAAWTGAASAAGPLMAGALVDVLSWRAVFMATALAGVTGLWLVGSPSNEQAGVAATRGQPIPVAATVALVMLFGGAAYLLMTLAGGEGTRAQQEIKRLGGPGGDRRSGEQEIGIFGIVTRRVV